ncbi:MAG: 2Fe-2S iron-sulfur cluster binding domain-containing protein, partial [Clostridiales bacterium]|nr:2Fe-2S iron-sulfur cluster binding domain-containing protein [Clostridiales bacterium]
MKLTVISSHGSDILQAERETSLLEVLQKNGIEISASCGGTGKCGKCLVEICEGDKSYQALACRVKPREGMT